MKPFSIGMMDSNLIKIKAVAESSFVVERGPLKGIRQRLRYLYVSNEGLFAFYDNLNYRFCPKCKLLPENLIEMAKDETSGRYSNYENSLGPEIYDGTYYHIKKMIIWNSNRVWDTNWYVIDYRFTRQ